MSHPAGHDLPPDAEHFRSILVQVLEARRTAHLAAYDAMVAADKPHDHGARMALLARADELTTIIHTHLREPQTPT
jgi:uncharacterized protein (DUF2252 family)